MAIKMVLGIWGVLLLLLPLICCSACLEDERISLLDFKQGLNFTYYKEERISPLESWRGFNCCAWEGVGCHPQTGHVFTLDLSHSDDGFLWSEIRGGLFQLLHLEHLDLSYNYFNSLSIPPQIGDLRRLKYLSLEDCGFIGQIPRELTKLQQLEHLNLGYNNLHGVIPRELTKLQQLKHLDLGFNNLHGAIPREIGNMSALKFLDLSGNSYLQSNKLEEWITHMRGLEQLLLDSVNFSMAGDSWVGNIASLTNLTTLSMYGCGLFGEIPPSFANLSRLQYLDLSTNLLRGEIPAFLGALPLSFLRLSSNKLKCSIPSTLGNLSALRYLEMGDNSLSGPIPISFAKLSMLWYLSLANNSLNGTFSIFNLNNCTQLTDLDLSRNMFAIKVSASTIPKFQLVYLALHQCNITGNFPAFISTQYSIRYLDLSRNSLSGSIPNWLWEFPSLLYVDLSDNLFDGSIIKISSKYIQVLRFLLLARNNFSCSISNFICKIEKLEILDLSNNRLSGRIPQCLKNHSMLSALNLEKNKLEGMIPNVCEGMNSLEILKLGDNMLKENITSSLGKCSSLKILDLRNNNLQGSIENWVKGLQSLQILILKNNKFNGKIPLQLTKLHNLQILDMSNNNFSGVIPNDLMKFPTMENESENTKIFEQNISASIFYIDEITIKNKGQDMEFIKILRLVKCLDLSDNSLSGNIPWNIGYLKGLIILNISRNYFNGEIPKSLGEMTMLQSLDLSQNTLSGAIPTELQHHTSLSYFDVSYNNLSGMIPQAGQMMTFDSKYFSNNSGLCGLQIYTSCSSNHHNFPNAHEEANRDSEDDIWWDMGMATGYVISFSIVIGMLWINKAWSVTCFKYMDAIIISLFQAFKEKL